MNSMNHPAPLIYRLEKKTANTLIVAQIYLRAYLKKWFNIHIERVDSLLQIFWQTIKRALFKHWKRIIYNHIYSCLWHLLRRKREIAMAHWCTMYILYTYKNWMSVKIEQQQHLYCGINRVSLLSAVPAASCLCVCVNTKSWHTAQFIGGTMEKTATSSEDSISQQYERMHKRCAFGKQTDTTWAFWRITEAKFVFD